MKRVIAFDGVDCLGKTTVINQLKEELIRNEYIPYVFHLTSPTSDYNGLFNQMNFGTLNNKQSDSLLQWSKFKQLFDCIKVILSADLHNVVILDRTPYSENIWLDFFGRINSYNNENILLYFLQDYKELNNEIKFINLDVSTVKIADRILLRDADRKNYLNAFDLIYDKNKLPQYNPDESMSKILYMVNKVKESFNKLFVILRQNNIEVITLQNETPDDINNIIKTILQ